MRYAVATHGYAGYTNGCRCDECRAAKRIYMRDKRAQASRKRTQAGNPRKFVADGITHGTYAGYTDAHCRCYLCAAAKADHDRRGRVSAQGNASV